jgi:hypothetical protein
MMMLLLRPPAARCELRDIAKPAALNDQEFRAALVLLGPNPRARGARRASDVGQQSHPQSGGQQSDPRSGRPARAGWAAVGRRPHFVLAEFVLAKSGWGRTLMMMLLLRPPAARCELRGIAKPAALNDQGFRDRQLTKPMT